MTRSARKSSSGAETLEDPPVEVSAVTAARSGTTRVQDSRGLAMLGRYTLLGEIARGGMGIVYLGVVRGPAGFSKLFAVKELKPELASDEDAVTVFLEEARLAARMSHPNVAQTLEVGTDGDRHFIGMEYMEGQALSRVVDRCGATGISIPVGYALAVVGGLLDGLHYAHTLADVDGTARGVVHRDVSPHNVFVTFDGGVKILDFGVAKAVDSSHHTETGVLKGKVSYMSPEQAQGEDIDARADIFCAGAILWELVAGRRLWGGVGNDIDILRALLVDEVPSLRAVAPETPPSLLALVERAMAPRPSDRFETAAAMRAEIDALAVDPTLRASSAREVAGFTRALFKDEREQVRARIERDLKLVAASESMGALATERTPWRGTSIAGSTGGTGSSPAGQHAGAHAGTHAGTHHGRTIAFAILIAAVGAGAIRLAFLEGGRHASSAPPPSSASVAPTSLAASVHVSVDATPANARIAVDGVALDGNPANASFARNDATHSVRAEADGFVPAQVEITFDRDRALSLVLAPRPPAPAASSAPSTASTSRSAPVRMAPRKKDDLEPF